MKLGGVLLLNVLVSLLVSVSVLAFGLEYAPYTRKLVIASNENKNAITKLSKSLLEVIKRLHEIAPPKRKGEP
jgi:hypothetical protein